MIINKRKSVRVPVNIPVQFLRGHDQFLATAINLSEDGMFLKSDERLSANETIELVFRLAPESQVVRWRARVIWGTWVEDSKLHVSGGGVQFAEIPAAEKQELHQFIEDLLKA